MNVQVLVEGYIHSTLGWAVAEQFMNSWENPSAEVFEQQNYNALRLIRDEVGKILDCELLADYAQAKLDSYFYKLNTYLRS